MPSTAGVKKGKHTRCSRSNSVTSRVRVADQQRASADLERAAATLQDLAARWRNGASSEDLTPEERALLGQLAGNPGETQTEQQRVEAAKGISERALAAQQLAHMLRTAQPDADGTVKVTTGARASDGTMMNHSDYTALLFGAVPGQIFDPKAALRACGGRAKVFADVVRDAATLQRAGKDLAVLSRLGRGRAELEGVGLGPLGERRSDTAPPPPPVDALGEPLREVARTMRLWDWSHGGGKKQVAGLLSSIVSEERVFRARIDKDLDEVQGYARKLPADEVRSSVSALLGGYVNSPEQALVYARRLQDIADECGRLGSAVERSARATCSAASSRPPAHIVAVAELDGLGVPAYAPEQAAMLHRELDGTAQGSQDQLRPLWGLATELSQSTRALKRAAESVAYGGRVNQDAVRDMGRIAERISVVQGQLAHAARELSGTLSQQGSRQERALEEFMVALDKNIRGDVSSDGQALVDAAAETLERNRRAGTDPRRSAAEAAERLREHSQTVPDLHSMIWGETGVTDRSGDSLSGLFSEDAAFSAGAAGSAEQYASRLADVAERLRALGGDGARDSRPPAERHDTDVFPALTKKVFSTSRVFLAPGGLPAPAIGSLAILEDVPGVGTVLDSLFGGGPSARELALLQMEGLLASGESAPHVQEALMAVRDLAG